MTGTQAKPNILWCYCNMLNATRFCYVFSLYAKKLNLSEKAPTDGSAAHNAEINHLASYINKIGIDVIRSWDALNLGENHTSVVICNANSIKVSALKKLATLSHTSITRPQSRGFCILLLQPYTHLFCRKRTHKCFPLSKFHASYLTHQNLQ